MSVGAELENKKEALFDSWVQSPSCSCNWPGSQGRVSNAQPTHTCKVLLRLRIANASKCVVGIELLLVALHAALGHEFSLAFGFRSDRGSVMS